MFPRLSHQITPDHQHATKRLLVRSFALELDKDACKNCGVCLTACPIDSIKKGAPGASVKALGNEKVMAGVLLDPATCSYCGTCSYLCPFDALHLIIDGERVKHEDMQLVAKGALPRLVSKTVNLINGKTAKQYMDGHLEYTDAKCQSGCRTCTTICPTGALSFQKMSGWEVGEKFVIDREKCMYCGACAFSCPTGAIRIVRDKITTEGKFTDPFWPSIQKKLLGFHGSA